MSTERAEQRDGTRRVSQRAALVSVGVRTVLVVLKYIFAMLSGSMAMMAEAVRNIPDIAQSAALYAGIRISDRKTEAFPYGLYKIENLISLGVAILIAIVGYEMARNVIVGGAAREIENLPWSIAAMVAAMAISYGFSVWQGRIAERTGSPALKADSRDALIDTLTTLAVLISLISAWLGYNIDLWATLLIVLFIVYTSAELGVDAIRVLLDASVERELLDEIEAVLKSDPDVIEVHDLTGRNSGPYRFIEAHVVLDVEDLDQAHQVSYRLEQAVQEMADNIDRILIHFEPQQREEYTYAVPLAGGEQIADHFGEAQRFALVTIGLEDREIRDVQNIDNPHRDAGSGKGIKVAQMLIERGVNAVFVREGLEEKGPYYALEGEHVTPIVTHAQTLSEALEGEGVNLEAFVDEPSQA